MRRIEMRRVQRARRGRRDAFVCDAARETLITLAAEQWKVEPTTVRIENAHFINHDASKTLTLAEVAKGNKLVKTIPPDVAVTPVSNWTVAGGHRFQRLTAATSLPENINTRPT